MNELQRLEADRAAWLATYNAPRPVPCSGCGQPIGTLFLIDGAEQPLMDAVADGALGGVPTPGFFVLAPQDEGALIPITGRRRYGRAAQPANSAPPAWVGLPGAVTCAACGALVEIAHPRFPQQERLNELRYGALQTPRRRWRR